MFDEEEPVVTKTDVARAAQYGVTEKMLKYRVYNTSWDKERAITTPPGAPKRKPNEWVLLAESNGVNSNTFWRRVRNGWTQKMAATTPVKKGGGYP